MYGPLNVKQCAEISLNLLEYFEGRFIYILMQCYIVISSKCVVNSLSKHHDIDI